MPKIFISYRRADSSDSAGRMFDRLVAAFGPHNVFKDVDSISPGSDFPTIITHQLADCDALIAVIGPRWLEPTAEGGAPRLHDPGDFVRQELEQALSDEGMLIVPALVGHAPFPDKDRLPESLHGLAHKNAQAVRPDPDFHRDMDRLIRILKQHQRKRPVPPQVQTKKHYPALLLAIVAASVIALLLVCGLAGWSFFGASEDPAIRVYSGSINRIAYSPDGSQLHVSGLSGLATIDRQSGKLIAVAESGTASAPFILSASGEKVAATTGGGQAGFVCDLKQRKVLLRFEEALANCDRFAPSPAFSSDEKTIALAARETAGGKWSAYVIEISSKKVLKNLKTGDGQWIPWVTFADRDRRLITYTDASIEQGTDGKNYDVPGNLVAWDLAAEKSTAGAITYYAGAFYGADAADDGAIVALATSIQAITWQPLPGGDIPTKDFSSISRKALLTPDGKYLIGVGRLEGLNRIKVASGEKYLFHSQTAGDRPVPALEGTYLASSPVPLEMSPDGKLVVYFDGKEILLFNVETAAVLHRITPPLNSRREDGPSMGTAFPLNALAIRPDGKEIAAADEYGAIYFWTVPSP